MFEEVPFLNAKRVLDARELGFSQVRLLPKGSGFRPIINLRKRATKLHNGRLALGRSINSIMTPVFNVLDFERRRQPDRLGSALFSAGDMYPKLKAFRQRLLSRDSEIGNLYFAKADADSCFDTIPQDEVVRLMEKLTSDEEYRIARHSEIRCTKAQYYKAEFHQEMFKPIRKFSSIAKSATDFVDFKEWLEEGRAFHTRNTVFVDGIVRQYQSTDKLLALLKQHVQSNIVKIGKKYFRQKAGIPQGSVLSSLLCNYFYAELERDYLTFLDEDESLLLRLIDDFLLITINKAHAKSFLQVMHQGINKYGMTANPAKSLANFALKINGVDVRRWPEDQAFPFCGNVIDVNTLEITKDRDRRKTTVLADTLTVESAKTPGRTFYRKALNALKLQTHQMLVDTSFNSIATVLTTVYQNFIEAAMKFSRYIKSMENKAQPHLALLIGTPACFSPSYTTPLCLRPLAADGKIYRNAGTIGDLIDLAFVLIKAQHKCQPTTQDYHCAVSKRQVQW